MRQLTWHRLVNTHVRAIRNISVRAANQFKARTRLTFDTSVLNKFLLILHSPQQLHHTVLLASRLPASHSHIPSVCVCDRLGKGDTTLLQKAASTLVRESGGFGAGQVAPFLTLVRSYWHWSARVLMASRSQIIVRHVSRTKKLRTMDVHATCICRKMLARDASTCAMSRPLSMTKNMFQSFPLRARFYV